MEFVGQTPTQLMEEREKHIVNNDRSIRMVQENLLRDFYWKLKKDGLSPHSLATAWDGVRSLYRAYFENRNDPGRLAIGMPESPYLTRTYQIPNHKQLKAMVQSRPNATQKAYILCQKDSGLSMRELLTLTWNHNMDERGVCKSPHGTLMEQLKDKRDVIHLAIFRVKENVAHDSLIGEEGADALRKLVQKRPDAGADVFDISKRMVAQMVHDAGLDAGITTRPHQLRKWFITVVMNSFAKQTGSGMAPGQQSDYVDYWVGHRLPGVRGTYFKPEVKDQIEIYQKIYPSLRVLGR